MCARPSKPTAPPGLPGWPVAAHGWCRPSRLPAGGSPPSTCAPAQTGSAGSTWYCRTGTDQGSNAVVMRVRHDRLLLPARRTAAARWPDGAVRLAANCLAVLLAIELAQPLENAVTVLTRAIASCLYTVVDDLVPYFG